MWIEFTKKYDRWKVGDKSQHGTSKALGYIRRGLAQECKPPKADPKPDPPKPGPIVETATVDAPEELEVAHVTPQQVRRPGRRGRRDSQTGGDA